MVIGFKPQFEKPICDGVKIHTIRQRGQRKYREGQKLQLSVGVRTKNYRCFKEVECKGVERIFMTYTWLLKIEINGRYLTPAEKEELAKNDGFSCYEDFEAWFYGAIQKSEDRCFSGEIIHWTSHRYGK